jgi:hypothetical protein
MREAASSRRRPALLLPTVQDDEPDHAGVHPFGEHRRLDGQRAGLVDGRVVGRHFGLALGRPPSPWLRRCGLGPSIDATIGSSPGQRAASSAVGSIAGCNGLAGSTGRYHRASMPRREPSTLSPLSIGHLPRWTLCGERGLASESACSTRRCASLNKGAGCHSPWYQVRLQLQQGGAI